MNIIAKTASIIQFAQEKKLCKNMIAELKTHYYFTDYDVSKLLIPDVDWVRLTLTCSFFNPKTTMRL